MDEVHRSHVRERDQLTDDIEESSTSIDMCKDRVKGLEEQYRFFQEMRGYVRDLVECLNEKVGVKTVLGGIFPLFVGGIHATCNLNIFFFFVIVYFKNRKVLNTNELSFILIMKKKIIFHCSESEKNIFVPLKR
jgi:hypothetical protein